MKLVIDIPYQIKECLNNENEWTALLLAELKDIVNNGIPLEQEPCDGAISRQAVLELVADYDLSMGQVVKGIHELPSVNLQPKTGYCKNCKWWKDSDGVYRRGSHAESQCPINRREVLEGNGYCYLFELQAESEE